MKIKRIFSLICIVFMLCTLCFGMTNVSAQTYGKKAETGTYTHLVGRLVNNNVHQIYKHSSNWILFYTKKNLTDVVYHEKGHGEDTLSYSRSVSLSQTKTTEWSANTSITTNASVTIAEILEVGVSTTVGAGYGESYAQGKSFTSASEVTKQIKDSAPTGYYTRVPGYTFYKMQDTVTKIGGSGSDTLYFDVPYGEPVIFTIYSKNNASWSIY